MSNQGIRGFYQITNTLKDKLLEDVNINTVTTGDISDINLRKQDMFPMAHIIVNSVVVGEQTLSFNLSVLSMDMVNQSKDLPVDIFTGNNNLQDILNTHLGVLNKLIQLLRRGSLHTDQYQLVGDPTLEPFYDRFENQLAGFTATMDIIIYNDITIC
jgi:hypothetical protein|tara:strand:- start:471 stop:941 length:471 start_codon:yes stop_codon:yes gene_type:complete